MLNTLAMFWGLSTIIIRSSKEILLLTSDIPAKNNADPNQPNAQSQNGVAYEKTCDLGSNRNCLCTNLRCVNSLVEFPCDRTEFPLKRSNKCQSFRGYP